MRQVTFGKTGLKVSALCLGTMTWGSQNTEAEGHLQADMALDAGLTFWDTAEMYPVNPVRAETVGQSEAIIGSWLAKSGGRDRLVLATKVSGHGQAAVRNGAPISGAILRQAVDASLKRLKTDYIDLYQLHWPNRPIYHFRNIWAYDPHGQTKANIEAHMLDILAVSAELIQQGKIRHIAVSNETVWGVGRWLALADANGLPRLASVQNEYSLLCRQFDSDWAELSVHEDLPLMAFSPLACGILSGKYMGDVIPPGSRRSVNPSLSNRMTARVLPATAAYLAIAAAHGLDPSQMALAFCLNRPFQTIPITGATSTRQLASNIAAADLTLSPEVLSAIAAAYRAHPQPY